MRAVLAGIQSCIDAESKVQPIVLDLSLYPRPQAVLEAVRRYEGLCQQRELDTVRLVAKVGASQSSRYSSVQLVNKSVVMEGAGYGLALDFSQSASQMATITIQAAQDGEQLVTVPFYLEKQREIRMPVVESLSLESSTTGAAQAVALFGVYVHLNGR